MFEFLAQSAWAERIGWVLVHSLWQFALVAVLAAALQWALKRCSAGVRYGTLLVAMSMMVAVPVVTWFSPWAAVAPAVAVSSHPVEKPAETPPSQHDSLSHAPGTMASPATPAESPLERASQPEPRRLQPARVGLASSLSLVERRIRPWLSEIVLLWFAGVFVAALRPLLSWRTVRRLRSVGVSPVPDAVHKVLERTAKRLRLARAVEVLQSTLVKTPVVVGCFRPAVLLPLCVVTGLPEPQLELILAHELAHIRRHDYLVNVLQTLAETLFFYHPAVWWLSRQIRGERENCCDDVAMATVGTRAEYGRALLAIEELRAASPALSVPACGGSLVARIRRIAGREPAPRIAGGGSILCVILVSIAILAAATWAAAPTAEKPGPTPSGEGDPIMQATANTVVTGQIVDTAGKAVAGAKVAVVALPRNPSPDILLADGLQLLGLSKAEPDGRFHLTVPRLSSAAYFNETKVVAIADGFNLGWHPIGEDVERPCVTVTLSAEETIHGKVLDSSGKPAADIKVYVTSIGKRVPGGFEGIQCWTPPSQLPFWPQPVTTDHDGRFALRGVDRSQIVNVQVRDDRFAIDWMQVGSAGEKDPHVTTSASGDVILSPPPARIFEGKVTYDDTHRPAANARVKIGASTDPTRCITNMAARTDADGRFRMNPYSGRVFFISVYPSDGEPYLSYQKEIELPDGQQPPLVEIALPRGVLLHGKITDKASGEPVAGATIKYQDRSQPPYRPDRLLPKYAPPPVFGISGADGTYRIAIPPGRGTLFVQGPRNDYIRQTIDTWDFNKKASWAQWHYVSAYALLDVKPNQEDAEFSAAIRRGVKVRGSIVGPEGRPAPDVLILSSHFLGVREDTWRGGSIRVKGGQFELHGLNPDASVPFYFLDPDNETGATVEISGSSANHGPLVVHLQPCGKAIVRFVDSRGKPRAKYHAHPQIVVSPGPFQGDEKRAKKEVSSDQDFVSNFDREHYWDKPVTNDEGRCTFPALIPGATYRIGSMKSPGDWEERDFSVKSGETLRLPDIVVPEATPDDAPVAAEGPPDSRPPAKEPSPSGVRPRVVGSVSTSAAFRVGHHRPEDAIVLQGYDVLMRPAVVKELKITPEQREKLRKIQGKFYADIAEFGRQSRSLPPDESSKAFLRWQREEQADIRKQVEEVLTPEQMETLNELTCQAKAYLSLSYPNSRIRKKLDLTEEQQGKLRLLQNEAGDRIHEDREERIDKILALLSPEQREQLRQEAFGPDWPDSYRQLRIEIGGDIGMIYVPSLDPYPDVTRGSVRKELGLSSEQEKQVQKPLGGSSNLAEKLVEEWRKLSPAERKKREKPAAFKGGGASAGSFRSDEERKKWVAEQEEQVEKVRHEQWAERQQDPLVKANAELVRQFAAILTPEQLARYKDMAFRQRLDEGLVDRIILKKIGANDQQIEAFNRLFEESIETYHRLTRETGAKMLKILTPAQQEMVREKLFSAAP